MTILQKLQADIETDADLPIEERLASLTSDAIALAKRLDKMLEAMKPTDNYVWLSDDLYAHALAIAEGRDNG